MSDQAHRSDQSRRISKVLTTIGRVRARASAPPAAVDRYGAHALGDPSVPREVWRFQILVALILSSRTQDITTARVMGELRQKGLSVPMILRTRVSRLKSMIGSIGMANRKSQQIKATAKILQQRHHSKVPDSFDALMELPGVGQKVALLMLWIGFGRAEGISVDTHVHKIANRMGWVDTTRPESTREALEGMVTRRMWGKVNHRLVAWGQTVCGRQPRCDECAVANDCAQLF